MSYGNEFSFEGVARTMKEEVKILNRHNSFAYALLDAIEKEMDLPSQALTLGGAQYRICSHIWDVHFPDKPRPFPCPDKMLEAMPMKSYILKAAFNKAFEDVDLAIDVIKRNQLPDPPKEDEPKPSFEQKHNVIQIRPSSNIQDAEITALYGTEAFYILAYWVFKMIVTEKLIPVLDYVRDFKKNRNTYLDEQITKMLAPIEGYVVFTEPLKDINSWNDRKAYAAAFAEAQDIRRRGLEPAINEKWDKLWQDDASKSLAANDLEQPSTLTDMITRLKAIVLDPTTPSALGMTDRTLFNAAVQSCEHVASVTTHISLPGDLARLEKWSKDVWAEFDAEARKIAGRMRAPEQEQVKRIKY
ncbi:hypothetical protein F4806DRAFT_502586 [Annulohypoxylon nitens]|nr:hypothetical protein F4806DRAFT_502586 [Annulohypoxylon nitens]